MQLNTIYKYLFGLGFSMLALFLFTSNAFAGEDSDGFDVVCNQDATPLGTDRECILRGSLPGQMYTWDYVPIQTDVPEAGVDVCINTSGVMDDGVCWNIQQRNGGFNSGQIIKGTYQIDGCCYNSDPFRYFVARVRVRSNATNNNNHTGRFNFYSRWVTIDEPKLKANPNPIPVGGSTNLEFEVDFPERMSIIWEDTDGTVGEDVIGNGPVPLFDNYNSSHLYSNYNGIPGIARFKLKVWGPMVNGNYGFVEADYPTLTVLGNMTGTLVANYSSCTKSGSNTCNLTLTYTSSNAIALHIRKDSGPWRDMTSVPNGSTVEVDPQIGTHTYQLTGSDGGAFVGLAQVTVTIYPESSGSAGPTCTPGFVQTTTTDPATTFTGSNGTNFTWTTSTNGVLNTGTPGSGAGNTFATRFTNPGTHRVTVTANGQSNYCTVFIPGSTPPVTCSPNPDSAGIYSVRTYTASGGDGNYTWTAGPDAGSSDYTSNPFNVVFNSVGSKTVTVTSAGMSATCYVTINFTNCPTLGAPSGQVLPDGTTGTTFNFNSAPGRTNYIVDITTDPGFSWWWNNGTGQGGPGIYRPSSPVSFAIQESSSNILNNYYAQANINPVPFVGGATYYWRVYGYDANNLSSGGCHSPIGTFSIGTTTPKFTILYEPVELENLALLVDNDICRRLNLSWTFTPAGVAQGFRVYRSSVGDGTNAALGSYNLIATLGINARSYSDTTVVTGTQYYYRVDPYTTAAPPRQKPSNEVTSTSLECNANFKESTFSVYQVNGAAYVPGTTPIVNGSNVTFRMLIKNIGPANGTIVNMINTMSPNLTNFRNYSIVKNASGSTGNSTPTITPVIGTTDQTMDMSLSGIKCVSPDNSTSCGNATDRSCTMSGTPTCNSWTLTFTATVATQGNNNKETIEGFGRIQFTDQNGTKFQNIYMTTNLINSGTPLPPEFREVAP